MVVQSVSRVRAVALRRSAFRLGEALLDRVEVGAVGRQVKDAGADSGDRGSDASDLVYRKIVHNDHVTGRERRRQELLDVGAESGAGHRPVEDERSGDAGCAQAGNKGRGAPMAVWSGVDKAIAFRTPAIAADHVGGHSRLVEKDKRGRVHVALPNPPLLAMAGNVRAVLLSGPQALFLCERPSRRSVNQIVVSEPGAMPRAIRASRISARVMPFQVTVRSRSSAS